MQDREETSFTEVTGHGPYSDRTRPIKMLSNGRRQQQRPDATMTLFTIATNSSALTGR